MADQFFVECGCGRRLSVELFEAGTMKTCQSCRAKVSIPGSTQLKELNGDKYPFLNPIEKIQRTARLQESPFDGSCHACQAAANFQVPITINALLERAVSGFEGIRPTITGGVELEAGETEEVWQSTTFPLLLCAPCHAEFVSSSRWAKTERLVTNTIFVLILIGFVYAAIVYIEIIAALAGLLSLVGAAAWAVSHRMGKTCDPFLMKWVSKIRWVPEALAGEDEYKVSAGKSQRIKK